MKIKMIKDICNVYGVEFEKINVYKSSVTLEVNLYLTKFYSVFHVETECKKILIGTNGVTFENYDGEISCDKFLKLAKLYSCVLPILKEIIVEGES